MALVLQQVRPCDGACCKENPRWPNGQGNDCIYHSQSDGKESGGCQLMTGEETINPNKPCPALPDMDPTDAFNFSCVNWPHSMAVGRDTGGCCWQWVDDGN